MSDLAARRYHEIKGLLESQQELGKEFSEMIENNFWELVLK